MLRTYVRPARLVRACGRIASVAGLVVCFTLSPGIARPQDLRATIIAGQQAETAKHLKKYTPSRAEAVVIQIKDHLSQSHRGLYPLIGTVYSGSGLAIGAGYRRYYGDNAFFDLKGLYSIRNYKRIELSTDSPGSPHDRLNLHARVGWLDATEIPFYGIGTDTSDENQTSFRLQNLYAGAGAQMKPAFPFVLSADLTYEDYNTKKGLGNQPPIETQWGPSEVTGLAADPEFLHSRASAGIDWRPASGYARKGGLYELRYHNYRDRDNLYSFDRLDGEVVQHIPLIREKYVISLRGRVETALDDDDAVPFFLLSSLGGGNTLRGFSSWRFRDRHSLLLQAEWRWAPNRYGMDMALFCDAGKVTARRTDLDLDGLKSDVGIGVRLHGSAATFVRVELAFGNEGLPLVVAGGAAF